MSSYNEIDVIEELNSEYLLNFETKRTKEKIITKVARLLRYFPFRMKEWNRLRNLSKRSKNNTTISLIDNNELIPVSDKKGVVYSCITGDYDSVENPLLLNKCLDYVLFTDNNEIKSNVWTIIETDKGDLKGNLVNRFYKMHPFKYFGDKYDYSIYIDGNVQIISDVTSLYNVAKKSKSGLAMHKHYARDCAYDEADICIYNGKGDKQAINEQMEEYEKDGFPRKFGLLEATIIVTDLKSINSKKIYDEWWREFYNTNSKRDQLSLPYILWKNKYIISDVGIIGENEYLNPKFRIKKHK